MDHSAPGALKRWERVAKSLLEANSERNRRDKKKKPMTDVRVYQMAQTKTFDATHTLECVCVCVCGFSCCI